MLIFHITNRADWQAAEAVGRYQDRSLGAEGFIHCSFADQVARVANHHFRGQRDQRDLVLLVINRVLLRAEVRDEASADGVEVFPHVYGAINSDAVVQVVDFRPDADGRFHLPRGLTNY